MTEVSKTEPTWLESNSQYRVVKLRRPIRVEGKDVTELRLREPTLGDLQEIPAEAFDRPMIIIGTVVAIVSGLPLPCVSLLSASDAVECANKLAEMGFIATDAFRLLGSQQPSRATSGTTGPAS